MLSRIRAKKLVWPAVMTLLGVAFLIGLGNWQMQRRAWKQGLAGAIAERTHADPVTLASIETRATEGGDPEYARVKVDGRLPNDHELYFYDFDERLGPGYHVVTPLEQADGSIVFVNRGFIPQDLKDPAKRAAGQLSGDVSIVGLVREPPPPGPFTPANDPAKNIWHWYDLDAMAASALGAERGRVVPFIVDAEREPAPPGSFPKGGTTRLELPNRHLEYALTWYGLAAALVAVFAAFAVTRWRQPGPPPT
jgi:surfeit locus 1 family protein